MRPLVWKEFRVLAPLLPLFFLVFSADLVVLPLTIPLDQVSWFNLHGGLHPDSFEPFFLYVMGLTLGFSLFPREYEEKTIEFLHTLPVTRAQIFAAKWLAATLFLVLVALVRELVYAFLQSLAINSLLNTQFSLVTSLKLLVLSIVLASLGLAHGLLLSFGRQFGLLMVAFLGWGMSQVTSQYPELSYLHPLAVGEPTFYGRALLVPWDTLRVHLPLALLCLAVAHYLWSRRGHQGTQAVMTVQKWRKTVGCLMTLAVLTLLILWVATSDDSEESVEGPKFPSYETARLETEHYNFTYPISLSSRAANLAAGADDVYEQAFAYLGEEQSDALVVADLTDVSEEHLGIASTGKLKLDLTQNEDPQLLKHILFHETCHVLCFRLAGSRGRDYSRPLAFFSEGCAEYFSFQAVESPRNRRDARRHALAMWSRHNLKFSDLIDGGTMDDRFEGTVSYTLGEIWVAALVDCYGDDAPRKVWKAVGREGGPTGLEAEEFWRDTLQACGYDLERVCGRWLERLARLEDESEEFLKALPRVRGRAIREEDGGIVIRGKCDREWDESRGELVIRVRARNSSQAQGLPAQQSGDRVWVHLPGVFGTTFEYQFGVSFSEDGYPYLEEWKSAKGL